MTNSMKNDHGTNKEKCASYVNSLIHLWPNARMFINHKGLSNSIKSIFHFRWFPWDLKPSSKLYMWDWRQQNSLKCKLHGVLLIFFLTNFAKGKKMNTFTYSRDHDIFNQLQRGERNSVTLTLSCPLRYVLRSEQKIDYQII